MRFCKIYTVSFISISNVEALHSMESDIETREKMLSHSRNIGIASGSAGTSVMNKKYSFKHKKG